MLIYIVASGVIAVLCFLKRLSLIPVMGVLTCGYLMTELGITNWIRFLLWLLAGLIIYFFYSYRHSNLHRREEGKPVGPEGGKSGSGSETGERRFEPCPLLS